MGTNIAVNSFSRVFLIEGGARPDVQPAFQSCVAAGPIEQAFGTVTSIECPDPNRYGQFIEVGVVRGQEERPTISLSGRYLSDVRSELLRLAKNKCGNEIHVHFGACENPQAFNQFSKAVVLEDALISDYSTDDLGVLSSEDQESVGETAEMSGKNVYEIVSMGYTERAGTIVTNEVLDVTICDTPACAGCDAETDGCQKIYAVTLDAGGSPSTPNDVVYSLDGGTTFYALDVDGMSDDTPHIACVGDYVVVASFNDAAMFYALKSDFDGSGGGASWNSIGTPSGNEPGDIWSVGSTAFVVGENGYIWKMTDPTASMSTLDAGVATAQNLFSVHALDDSNIIAGGGSGTIVHSSDGENFGVVTAPAASDVNAVWMLTERIWFAGLANGSLYYTINQGTSWVAKTFSGSGSGVIHDIAFSSRSVGYISHATSTPSGRILRTYDGGYSWNIEPAGSNVLPANDRVSAIAACKFEPNMVIGVGLADNGTDGYVVLGTAG